MNIKTENPVDRITTEEGRKSDSHALNYEVLELKNKRGFGWVCLVVLAMLVFLWPLVVIGLALVMAALLR
jgi:hypothetical protein